MDCPSLSPQVCSNSYPLNWYCHPTISSSVIPFSCPQSFPASRSFQMSQLFASSSQSIGVSVSTPVLPMNTQNWFPLGWTGWISMQSKGLSRVFSCTTIRKHQFFGAHPSLWSNSYICTWLLEKNIGLTIWTFVGKDREGYRQDVRDQTGKFWKYGMIILFINIVFKSYKDSSPRMPFDSKLSQDFGLYFQSAKFHFSYSCERFYHCVK